MLSMESPRKPKNMIHRISDQQKPEQKDQKENPKTPTSPPKSSGTGNKEEKVLNFLNSLKFPEQLPIAVGKDIIDETMAKNILAARTRLGKFKSLNQVSAISGMDPNKFKALIESLSARF